MKTIKKKNKEAYQCLGSSIEFDVNVNNNDLDSIGRFALTTINNKKGSISMSWQ